VILWRKRSGKMDHDHLKNGSSKALLLSGAENFSVLNYAYSSELDF
jgi:hypothetical protein